MNPGGHLLLVDDRVDPDDQAIAALRGQRWSVIAVASLAEARGQLGLARPAVVLAAAELPDGAGLDLLPLAEGNFPLVIWTRLEDPAEAERIRQRGAHDCWVKSRVAEHAFPYLLAQARRYWQSLQKGRSAELALQEERSRLATIIDASRIGTWEWNVQTGQATFNEGWAALAGYTLAELAPLSIATWERLAHPDDLRKSGELLEQYFAGALPYYEFDSRIRHKAGHWVWVNDRGKLATRTPTGAPLLMCGTHTDITARKLAEASLQENETKLRTIFDTMSEGVALNEIVYDAAGEMVDYRIIEVNRAFYAIADHAPGPVVGRCATEVYGMTPDVIRAFWRTHRERREVQHTELTSPRTQRCYHITTSPFIEGRFVTVFFDITAERQASRSAAKSEAQLRLAEKVGSMGHLEYNPASGLVTLSESARKLCGLPPGPTLIEKIIELLSATEAGAAREALRTAIDHREPIDVEFHYQRRTDGRHLRLHLSADFDATRGLFFGMIHDITERHQLLTELREKTFYLEKAQETAQLGAYRLDITTSRWTSSSRLDLLFGISENHPRTSAGWLELVPPTHRDELEAYLRDHVIKGAGRFDRDYPIIRPADGQERWLHGTGELEFSRSGQPLALIGTIQDITDRRRAEEALRLSEQRFRSIFQSVQFVAVQGYAPDGTTQYWNRASELLYGYSADEAIGRNLLDLIIPAEMQAGVRDAIAGVAATGVAIPAGERSLQRKDGSRVSVYSSHALIKLPGRPQELFCIDVDLTELRRAEARLQLQGNALNAAANGIVITDRNGVIEWANTAYARMSGYTLAEMIGRNPSKLVRSDRHDRAFYATMWQTILAGNVWHGEIINRRQDGTLYTEEMTITPIRDPGGEITQFIAVKQDITERKVLEERVRQAQKMEAIGQLAGGVAHDFNNILAAVLMYLGLMEHDPSLDPAVRNSLKDLTREVQRGAALTRQLLAFSRQQAMAPDRINLADVVNGLLKMLRRLLGETIQIAFEQPPGLPAVDADAGMMEQVIVNLCINARDAMPGGGKLTLRLDAVEVTPEAAATGDGRHPGKFVRLRVVDSGHGMSPEIRARIFEPFFTTKGVGKGTGLGLAMVYGIMQQHKGWVQVESRPGHGSVFDVYLPTSTRPHSAPTETPSLPPARGRGETILVVEDERAVRVTVAITLRQHGYQVLEAADGPSAIVLWQEHHRAVDLLLTDLVLPNGMNGFDLIDRLRAEKPRLKTVACTGYSREEITRAGPARTVPILRKPYDQVQLLNQIRRTLDSA